MRRLGLSACPSLRLFEINIIHHRPESATKCPHETRIRKSSGREVSHSRRFSSTDSLNMPVNESTYCSRTIPHQMHKGGSSNVLKRSCPTGAHKRLFEKTNITKICNTRKERDYPWTEMPFSHQTHYRRQKKITL